MLVHALEPWLGRHNIVPLYFVCVALPFYTFSNTLDGLARSYDWVHVALAPPYILRPLILIALMAAAHAVGFPTMDAMAAAIALAAATWVTAMLQLAHAGASAGRKGRAGPEGL